MLQGADEIVVDASAHAIWQVLEDGDRLTEWAFMVKKTTGGRERPGAVRHCEVEFGGRPGRITETCVEHVAGERIAWRMTEDSFGFGKRFDDMGFSFDLKPLPDGRTLVRNESFYRPRSLSARALSALVMRRKFAAIRRQVLANLKAVTESARH